MVFGVCDTSALGPLLWGGEKMASRWDKLGQELERVKDPMGFDIKAAIRPWTVYPDLFPENRKEVEKNKK